MKKLLLLFAITSLFCASCSDDDDDDDYTVTTDYYLTATPSTLAIGEDLTLTINGDGARELMWITYLENTEDGSGTCLIPYFENGTAVMSTENLPAGEYIFYSKCAETYLQTEDVYVTVTE
ncbi:MAG: hypothetical protein SNH94_04870 [Rikenellaceae bacterium]